MHEVLKEYCLSDAARGLLLLSMPTGSGKTYNVLNFIHTYYREFSQQERKILFVTNLKKNLPVAELRKRFEEQNELEQFEQHVLFVDSNANSVIDNLLGVEHEIPEDFKTDSFSQLRTYVEVLSAKGKLHRTLLSSVEKSIRTELEPAFRKFITEHLREEFRTKAERLEAIRCSQQYQWIGKLYPAVFTDERTVLFMSIDKFLVKNSTLIEPSYYMPDRLAKHSVVFIDEFDATKDNVLKNIIQSGIRHKTNLLDLFLNIHGHLMQSECPASLLFESDARTRKREERDWLLLSEVMGEMKLKADKIFSDFSLQHACKSHEDFSQDKRNFLFYDFQFHHVLDARHKRIEIIADKASRANWITAVEAQSDPERQGGNNIRSLLREISGFLTYFQRGIGYIADNYRHLKDEDDAVSDIFPLESAVRTTLNHFRLDRDDVEFLVLNIMEEESSFAARKERNNLQRSGFYETGFRYHDIVDSDDHDTLSKIYMYDFNRTPESFLCDVCASSFVVGISATAGLHSNIGNYDLDYLEATLGESYVRLSEDTVARLELGFDESTAGYDKIKINAGFIGCSELEGSISQLAELLDDQEAAKALWNKLCMELKNEDDASRTSIYNRYVRTLVAWRSFLDHSDCQAFLCLFSKQVKPKDPRFDFDILKSYASMIMEACDNRSECIEDMIVALGGEGFDARKQSLLTDLENGRRRFVLSTYQTIGAGQNLQYGIPESAEPIHINNFPAREEMDFDGIYLDRPTNLLVNIYADAIKDDDFIKYLFQLEFLVENGTISSNTFSSKLDEAFCRYVGKYKKRKHPGDFVSLYTTEAYTRYVNKTVMQAVGRICRSNMKAPTIHVLADEFLKKHLLGFSIPRAVIPVREYRDLIKAAGQLEPVESDYSEAENRASSISKRASAYIRRQLQTPWAQENIKEWQELREQVLRRPVTDEFKEGDSRWHRAYVQLPIPSSRYWYSQQNDYRDVSVFFSSSDGDQAVDEISARLSELMSIEELRALFESKRWATRFQKAAFMLCPPMFNNIYKGALGEVCGKHILEKMLELELLELDASEYELFDYKTEDGTYIDFKLWNDQIGIGAQEQILKIQDKMNRTEAKKVFIINLLGSPEEQFRPVVSSNEQIFEIPFLCQRGEISMEAMEYLMKELLKCRK